MEDQLRSAVEALEKGEIEKLHRLVENTPEVLSLRDENGTTLLGLACRLATADHALPPIPSTTAQLQLVDILLAAGADPALDTPDGWTPLHSAAMTDNVDLARKLIEAGAPLTGRLLGTIGGSPLSIALFYGRDSVAEVLAQPPEPDNIRSAAALGLLVDRFVSGTALTAQATVGLDFYRPTSTWPSWERNGEQDVLNEALTWAARNGRVQAMASLVKHGAQVNSNPYRGTSLLWAIYQDRFEAASWLLDHGADPDLRHDFGGTDHGQSAVALHLAAQYGAVRCLNLLLDRGADATIRDGAHGGTPLNWAEHVGSEEAASILRARLA